MYCEAVRHENICRSLRRTVSWSVYGQQSNERSGEHLQLETINGRGLLLLLPKWTSVILASGEQAMSLVRRYEFSKMHITMIYLHRMQIVHASLKVLSVLRSKLLPCRLTSINLIRQNSSVLCSQHVQTACMSFIFPTRTHHPSLPKSFIAYQFSNRCG